MSYKYPREAAQSDYLNRYDRMAKLDNRPLHHYAEPDRAGNPIAAVALIGMGAIMGMAMLAGLRACESEPQPLVTGRLRCDVCHSDVGRKHAKLANYFKGKGAKTPEMLATACLETKSPRLMAAITVKEGMAVTSRSGGYKKRHHGAWQVNPAEWGRVSHDPILQARQAEAILEELLGKRQNIKTALNLYGGDKTKLKYANDVLKELKEVPK